MRASAWASPPGLKPIPTRSRRTAQVLRIVRPSPVLRDAASASARGPRWAPAAPPAVETWSGCVEATRRAGGRVGGAAPPAAAAAPVAVRDEADHVRADRRRLDERLLEDLVRLRR